MSLLVPYSAFQDWQVDFDTPSLKYFYTLDAIFGVSKPVIVGIDRLTLVRHQSVSLKLPRPKNCILYCILYFVLYFVFEWPVLVYIFAHWSNIACLPAGRIYTQRHLVKAENVISNYENWYSFWYIFIKKNQYSPWNVHFYPSAIYWLEGYCGYLRRLSCLFSSICPSKFCSSQNSETINDNFFIFSEQINLTWNLCTIRLFWLFDLQPGKYELHFENLIWDIAC